MNKVIDRDFIKNKYIEFFKEKGHVEIPSASLIPENDPTVLFTTAGMHPLVPFLLGEKHPQGNRLVDIQKCIRTIDIDNVGDDTHCTFFEMLGNWSLGDYFKKESIAFSYEFLTDKKWLGLDPNRLIFSVFEGDDDAPRDEETYNAWRSHGVSAERLFFLPKEHNWWGPAGESGPCGPDTEIFYDTLKESCGPNCGPSCGCGKYVEIWNNVFMEYNKDKEGKFSKLAQKNVDTGLGVERTCAVLNGVSSMYDTPVFKNILLKLEELSNKNKDGEFKKSFRIVADHIRTATFILGDQRAVSPSNTDQGYVLRRLIRRAIRHLKKLEIEDNVLGLLAQIVIEEYKGAYKELDDNKKFVFDELNKEESLFNKTISQGIKEYYKMIERLEGNYINGSQAFKLYDTYGFPIEFTLELAKENGYDVDLKGYEEKFKEHQEKSRLGAEAKFKGGLADHSEQTTRLHTATHILHSVLRNKFGTSVEQKGSNITPERLRFDFSFDRKITNEELIEIENEVNRVIRENLDVNMSEVSYEEAKKENAIGLFINKYDFDKVKMYKIGNFSTEICGGPHVQNTRELGTFKILKEESSSAGVRRIKAILE